MTYHKTTQATNNIALDISSNEIILLSANRTIHAEPLEYAIWFTHNYSKIAIRIVDDNSITIQDYLVDNAEKAESKLEWLLKKYSLKVSSILYVTNYDTADIVCNSYSSVGLLEYSFSSTPTIPNKEVTVSYNLHTEDIDYQEFVYNFSIFDEMLAGHHPKLLIQQPDDSPQDYVRRRKLMNLGIV